MSNVAFAVSNSFSYESGFHRADWEIIGRWIESNVPAAEVEHAWNEAALTWVNRLCDDLGGGYFVVHSRQTILLSEQSKEAAQWLLDYAGRAANTIKEQIGEVAWQGASGKDVILIFSEDDDYYQYVAAYYPDGEHAASGGVCIHSGYTHIALPWSDELDAANAVIHELSHDSVAHLRLPIWLNEGWAVTFQKAIAPMPRALGQSHEDELYAAAINWRAPIMWDDLAERHFSFWNLENIQEFWAGTSFFKPGDSNELSYSLAEVFLKLMTDQISPPAFREFLKAARQDDAGQTAAMDILGIQLGEIAGTFLGDGDWLPKRKKMIECWVRAGWQAE